MPSRVIHPLAPIDIRTSLGFLAAGPADPAIDLDGSQAWVAQRTPEGPATLRVRVDGDVHAEAWGPGADWSLQHAPGLIGAEDDPSGFEPADPGLARLARRHDGVRILRSRLVTEALLRTVVSQVVTGREAKRSYRNMARAIGEKAPGPRPLLLPPDPAVVGSMAYTRFHPWGVERRRAETIIRVARHARRLEEAAEMPFDAAYQRLRIIPGVGAWTVAKVGLVALGDPDAVPVGDYHLPNVVSWALAGEPRGGDERMLELLQPFTGHRGRVIRLLQAAGIRAPKYGPRAPIRDFRRM